MKYLFAIGCLLLVTNVIRADEAVLEILGEHITPCAQEHNILPEEMSKFDETDLEGEDRIKFGCMKACVLKHTGVFVGTEFQEDKFGEITKKIIGDDADKLAAQVEIAKKCIEEAKDKTEECEFAYEFSRCLMLKSDA